MKDYLLAIGIMTGNSLDGVDCILSKFDQDGGISDLCSYYLPNPDTLKEDLKLLRTVVNDCNGDMLKVEAELNNSRHSKTFDQIESEYTNIVAEAVSGLIKKAKADSNLVKNYDLDSIDLIGSHGQTCAHFPPSVAKTKDRSKIYTVQIGNGQALADLTGITVVCDFRSDDLMNGGEAAPLAPIHHKHLAEVTRQQGFFPLAFCNAGNTGNISVISEKKSDSSLCVLGWDTGPFNNFIDKLVLAETGKYVDKDGKLASMGTVNSGLLQLLFDKSVLTSDGDNYLELAPPKSSDPEWYKLLPELAGTAPVGDEVLTFEDRLRTATYFSAYVYFYSLTLIESDIKLPMHFALCGGGWKNPLCVEHFEALVNGQEAISPTLPVHRDKFRPLQKELAGAKVAPSSFYGFDGTAMEASLFSDAAVSRIKAEPFSNPETTGAAIPTVAGIIRYPSSDKSNATTNLTAWLEKYNSWDTTIDDPAVFDNRWNRASAGWYQRLPQHAKTNGNLKVS